MALIRFKNGIEKLADDALIGYSNGVRSNMDGNSHFPSPVPALTVLSTTTTEFINLVNEARNGDRIAIVAKNAKRKALIEMLHNIASYVVFASGGNRDIAATAGIPFAKTPVPAVITVPTMFKVANGFNKDTLTVTVSRVKGAKAYMHQVTTDPTLNENSWQTHACSAASCMFSGLSSGVTYYVRVAVIGANDQLVYTPVITHIPQ